MTDTVRLRKTVEDSGLKKSFIAEKLGITYQGYYKKESGQSEFTASEIAILQRLLCLSEKDVLAIFLGIM